MKRNNNCRRSLQITPPKRVLILCEGLTEVIYIKGFCSEEKNRDIQTCFQKNVTAKRRCKDFTITYIHV